MKKIIIIGGGFAGINLANHLDKKLFDVTLIDKNNYNFFPPLLYQVATALLEPSNISYPYRKLFRKKNIRFRMGELLEINPAENKILLSGGEMTYDYLVLATGATTNYFGMEQVKRNALPMKNISDAVQLRNHFLLQLEKAAVTTDAEEQNKFLNVVIAGAGPTGVEIAGVLSELRRNVLKKDYPELIEKGSNAGIFLVDGTDSVIKSMSKKSQQYTIKVLGKMGVSIRLNCQVKDYENEVVSFANGEMIKTGTLIWAAGVSAIVFKGLPETSYGPGKRLITDSFNKVRDIENIYAIGDGSIQVSDPRYPAGHPQLAQVAIQQGRNLAANFGLIEKGRSLKSFHYFDKGSMAIIGRNRAVADLSNRLQVNGLIAWIMWLFVHLTSLLKHHNRFTTLYNWVIAYFTKDQSLRMIIPVEKKIVS